MYLEQGGGDGARLQALCHHQDDGHIVSKTAQRSGVRDGRRRRCGRDAGLAAAIRQKPLGGVRNDVRRRPTTDGGMVAAATSDGGEAAGTLAWLLRSGRNRWVACVTTCGGDQRQ
nr:unnamed protein product [Digitaria exilis]